MADPAFFTDAALDAEAYALLQEFGVDGLLRRRTFAAVVGDARSRTPNVPVDIAIKIIDGGAMEAFSPRGVIRNEQSVFFAGLNLGVTPTTETDSIVMKTPAGALTDELKITKFTPVFRGLESVILWEAIREG